MSPLLEAMLLALIAGGAIPLGGFLASIEHISPRWLKDEFHHAVIAFGGGALLSAIGLVLVPEGIELVSPLTAAISFSSGGLAFYWIDGFLERHKTAAGQLVAMLLDFLPEAVALGAALAMEKSTALLLAILIGLQNTPEAFNAFREMRASTKLTPKKILGYFCLLALLGPLAAWAGVSFFVDHPTLLGSLMLFAAGGILYLTFEDIAPQAVLKHHRLPALGAVLGFLLGIIGAMLTGS